MSSFFVDLYVISWKYYEKHRPDDVDFMASAACVTSVWLLILNIVQVIAFSTGRSLAFLSSSTKLVQVIQGVAIMMIGSAIIKVLLKRHPDLQSSRGITNRYSLIPHSRKVAVVVISILNLVILLLVHTFH